MLLDLFEKVLEMSLLGCYVIVVVLLMRLLLSKCERKYSYALWFVVFLNLCLPVSIEGPFSLIPDRLAEQEVTDIQSIAGKGIAAGEKVTDSDVSGENATNNTVAGNVINNNVAEDIVADGSVGNGVAENQSPAQSDSAMVGNATVDWEYVGNLNTDKEDMIVSPGAQLQMPVTEAEEETKVNAAAAEGHGVVAGTGAYVSSGAADTGMAGPEAVASSAIPSGGIHILPNLAGCVWVLGVTVILGISFYKGISLSIKLKKCREKQGISTEGVVCAEDINAPFLWGLWKPVIYLPTSIGAEESVYIIAHESYHRKRFDHIVKPVVFGIVTIHWFNPLVWLAYVLFVRDMEISCDEAVLAHTRSDIKKQYASSLLKYAAGQSGFVLAPLTFGEPSLKSRIKNVLGYKKSGLAVTIVAVCVVALTACGLIVRPATEDAGENKVVQGSDVQESTEPTAEPEVTKAPEDVQTQDDFVNSPYSVYFQDILQAKYVEADGTYQAIEERNPAVTYSYVEGVQEYKEMEPAYAATIDFYLADGGVAKINWLKLSEDVTLTDLTFDMSEEMIQSGSDHNAVQAMFYSKEENQVYLIICSMQEAMTWMICFSPESPTDYDIYDYEYSSWFGDSFFIGNHIYLHGGAVDTPYVIDTETKEGRLCTAEYTAARMATYEMSDEYGENHEDVLGVFWMQVFGRWEDVDIFSGLLMEAMDIFPGVADIYVASRDGEVQEVMIVEQETGEVTIVEDFSELSATRPLSQKKITWFNESFFNQGFAEEEVTVSESIRNQFLTCFYTKPEDINLAEVFYNGVGESMTEEDWVCIHGEERWKWALYDTDMNVLSEAEHAEVAAISRETDVIRVSYEEMNRLFEANTGLEVWDTNRRGMEQFYYNKHDSVYYLLHGDANGHYILVTDGYYNADGTVTLFYSIAPSAKWVGEAEGMYIAVLQPVSRDSYLFVSNCEVSTSSMGVVEPEGEQSDRDLDLSQFPEYFAGVLQEVMETGNYWLEKSNVENLQYTDRFADSGKVSAETDYQYQVTYLQTADGRILENISFDLRQAMQEGEMTNVIGMEVFLTAAQDKVYLLLAEGTEREDWYKGGMIVVAFSPEAPENYEVHSYPDVLGCFGSHEMLGEDIYVYVDYTMPPFEINVETWEGRYCEQELLDAKSLITGFADRCEEADGVRPDVWNFGASAREEDVDIFYGEVSQGMDDVNPRAGIYTAYHEGEYLGALLIDMRTGEISYTTSNPVESLPYSLRAAEHSDYNAVFEYNGYQYHFQLNMDTTNLFLRPGKDMERSNATGKWTVTPIYASNGAQEELLGEIKGFTFDITSDTFVEHPYVPGERIYGIIGEVTESSVTVQPVEVIDMDTYMEYRMDVVAEPVKYELAENVEFIMQDLNFRGVNITFKRFMEHSGDKDIVWCFVLVDGEVVEIYEPYMP